MARTQEWCCLPQIQWRINQEFKHSCISRGMPHYGFVRSCEKRERKDPPKKILDSIAKDRPGMEVKFANAADECHGSSAENEDEFCDAMIKVVMRTDLFAETVEGIEKLRVDLVVKNNVVKPEGTHARACTKHNFRRPQSKCSESFTR